MNEKLSARVEDYLLSIFDVTENKGYARIKDISREMSLKPSTVVGMMGKLKELKLVNYEKYGEIQLTSRGKEITADLKKKRETFEKFLEIILVPKKIAAKDAHILEHELDSVTIQQFKRFVDFITQKKSDTHGKSVDSLMNEFKEYCGNS